MRSQGGGGGGYGDAGFFHGGLPSGNYTTGGPGTQQGIAALVYDER